MAARKPVHSIAHGIERTDDYYWLRDPNWREVMQSPSRLAPDIRAYLEAENRYAEATLAHLSDLRRELVDEMKGRIETTESDVPSPSGPYNYWRKYLPNAEHPQMVRALIEGGPEELLLDGPALAAGKPYFSLGQAIHSPDHRLYAYSVDDRGAELHDLHIRNIASGHDLSDVIPAVASFAWARDSQTLLYAQFDDEYRERFVYLHRIGNHPAKDDLVYEEKDRGFTVSVHTTFTRNFIVIFSGDLVATETRLIDATRPAQVPLLVERRQPNLRYLLGDWGDEFLILTNADGANDFKIVTAPHDDPAKRNWRDLVPHKPGRRILQIVALAGHLVRREIEDGVERLVVRNKAGGCEHLIAFDDDAFAIDLEPPSEFDTRIVRFSYSSPTTPTQIFDYDVESRIRVLRKQQGIPSGHDPSRYLVQRTAVTTADGEKVPVTILRRTDLPLDGSAPLFLEGYGAYGFPLPASFDPNILSLVDRGFVYAIAHVRGGLEKGDRWHDSGRRERKVNSFTDFIAVAEQLVTAGYTSNGRIVAYGESAGGLLVGAVANMRPDLFAGIIARVPFADALNSMLDETLPLTLSDFAEWGDPIRDKSAYRTIASYAPYENVAAHSYPQLLVIAGISDPRVQYWEPAKWVAKIRAHQTNDPRIALVTHMAAGHFGPAGRYAELDEIGLMYAFAIDVIGAH